MRVKENASTAQAKPRRDWPGFKRPYYDVARHSER